MPIVQHRAVFKDVHSLFLSFFVFASMTAPGDCYSCRPTACWSPPTPVGCPPTVKLSLTDASGFSAPFTLQGTVLPQRWRSTVLHNLRDICIDILLPQVLAEATHPADASPDYHCFLPAAIGAAELLGFYDAARDRWEPGAAVRALADPRAAFAAGVCPGPGACSGTAPRWVVFDGPLGPWAASIRGALDQLPGQSGLLGADGAFVALHPRALVVFETPSLASADPTTVTGVLCVLCDVPCLGRSVHRAARDVQPKARVDWTGRRLGQACT